MHALEGVLECPDQAKNGVRQKYRGGGLSSAKSERPGFPAQHTMLQVCHPMAAVPVKCTPMMHGKGCRCALIKKKMVKGRDQGVCVWGVK